MTVDLPPDVRAVLGQLFAEARDALTADDRETATEAVETAETVATNKLPEGAFRGRLLHGCGRVRELLDTDPERPDDRATGNPDDCVSQDDRMDAAAAYLGAMERRVTDADRQA